MTKVSPVSIQPTLRDRLQGRFLDWYVRRLERGPRVWLPLPRPDTGDSTHLSNEKYAGIVRSLQNVRLRRIVKHAAQNSPFYRARFAEAGISPHDIRRVEDLQRLPPTTTAEFRDSGDEFLAVPRNQIAQFFTSSGTTGKPKLIYMTAADFEREVNLTVAGQSIYRPQRERTVCMIYNQQGSNAQWRHGREVVARSGGLPLTIGLPPFPEVLELIEQFRPNAFATNPACMAALTRYAEKVGFRYRLKEISLGGEILTRPQAERISDFWGAEVSDGYGLVEIGGVGHKSAGCQAFHVNEMQVFPEIVDPETLEPSNEGELLLTTLVNQAMPLLRYRTGDRCCWSSCPCGWQSACFHIYGRFSDGVLIAAINIRAQRLAATIQEIEGATGTLEMIADHVDGVDRLTLRIGREPGSRLAAEDVKRKVLESRQILEAPYRVGAFEWKVELVDNEPLPHKFVRVRDLRE